MGVAKVGDLRDRRVSWDSGLSDRVKRRDEISGLYCCVYGGGYSELK